jgi:eukaryotic-like serine/threonine-protein kinase
LSSDLEFVVSSGPEVGRTIRFPAAQFVLGSAEDVGARLTSIDGRHAEVEVDPLGVVWVRDLTGRHQLRINDELLERGALEPGGLLQVGSVKLKLRLAADTAAPSISPESRAPANRPPGDLKSGTLIDNRYVIVSKLAVGGMGEVYRATHVELGKSVVLKVMRARLSDDPHIVARFKREAIAASRIGQQNIVDVSDFGRTSDERFFFVMEYLDGITLKHLIAREGAQPLPRTLHLVQQIANALVAAHAQGIVHRDLKPENIMLMQRPGQADFVKVLDFGVAKVAPAPGQAGHTSLGMVMGTPQYMSPEQARAVVVDVRSDVYSLGLIFYELLAGKPTFVAETPSQVMMKHITEEPPKFESGLVARLPSDVERLVFRMLAKDPSARLQTMKEVADIIEAVASRGSRSDFVLERIASGTTEAQVPGVTAVVPRRAPAVAAAVTRIVPTIVVPSPALPEPEVGPSPPRSRTPLVVLAVLGVVVLVGLVVALRPTTPTPVSKVAAVPPVPAPVVPPQAPTTHALRLSSTTSADVFEGDVQLGTTPMTLVRPTGTQIALTFTAAGFKPLTRKVAFETDAPITIELEREKAPAPVKKPVTQTLKDVPF